MVPKATGQAIPGKSSSSGGRCSPTTPNTSPPADPWEAAADASKRTPATLEVLYFDGCPGHEALMPRLRELVAEVGVDAPIELKRVESVEAAERERFLGSPTLRARCALDG
jgi:hypothetical protein